MGKALSDKLHKQREPLGELEFKIKIARRKDEVYRNN